MTATREIDAVVQALKRQTSALTTRDAGAPRLSTGDQGSLRAHARAAVEAAAARAIGGKRRAGEPPAPVPIESRPARVGDTSCVPPFGLARRGEGDCRRPGGDRRARQAASGRRAGFARGRRVGEGRAARPAA